MQKSDCHDGTGKESSKDCRENVLKVLRVKIGEVHVLWGVRWKDRSW